MAGAPVEGLHASPEAAVARPVATTSYGAERRGPGTSPCFSWSTRAKRSLRAFSSATDKLCRYTS